jgi:hypothetical protein
MNSRILEIFVIVMSFIIMGLVMAHIYDTHERQACIQKALDCKLTAEEVLKVCR